MATREEAFFNDNADAFQLLDNQYDAIGRIQAAIKQINEIQGYLKNGRDTIAKLRMNIKYDQDQLDENRKRIVDAFVAWKQKETPKEQ